MKARCGWPCLWPLILVATIGGACAGPPPSPSPPYTPPAGTRSPVVSASGSPVTAVPSPSAATRLPSVPPPSASAPSPTAWGPLAVIPPQDGTDLVRLAGVLRITHACVLLDSPGRVVLLIWLADRTSWDPATRAITFVNFTGPTLTVRDGDRVVLGGSGSSAGVEGGLSNSAFLSAVQWVARPASSCPLGHRWLVGILDR